MSRIGQLGGKDLNFFPTATFCNYPFAEGILRKAMLPDEILNKKHGLWSGCMQRTQAALGDIERNCSVPQDDAMCLRKQGRSL